jgi:hypothetical protein
VCPSSGAEYTNLVGKLKKRISEIIRLTKTIKVVEIEVKEDNEPLRREI